jgi:nucleoside-diphosphate-sugar epimerase
VRVLVTGAAGFIGQHLCRELVCHEHLIIPVDRNDGDLREQGVAEELLDRYHPDLVVHLAARVGRLFGEGNPFETVSDNAGMTALVAKACGGADRPLVYASTSEVYGDGGEYAWEEADIGLAEPHNVYGLSKRWGEEVCRLYAPEQLTILRLSMPYGPGHPPGTGRAALTNFLDAATKRQTITVHKNSERTWCWIGDTARAVRLVIESGQAGAWNIGRDDNRTPMRKVAEMACDLVKAPHSLIEEVDPPRMQTVVKRLATEKLQSVAE